MNRHYRPYVPDRIHSATLVKCTTGRLCSYCHKRIDYIPSDVEARYVRFCILPMARDTGRGLRRLARPRIS